MRFTGGIIASVPVDLTSKDGVGQFSLDDDADLGAWVIVDRKHCPWHDRDPAEGQFRILDADRHGPAEHLARNSYGCTRFWRSVLGERRRRGSPRHQDQAEQDDRDGENRTDLPSCSPNQPWTVGP